MAYSKEQQKEIKSIRMKLNVHAKKLTESEIYTLKERLLEIEQNANEMQETVIENKESVMENKEPVLIMEKNTIETPVSTIELPKEENKEIVFDDDSFLNSLRQETYKAPEPKKKEENTVAEKEQTIIENEPVFVEATPETAAIIDEIKAKDAQKESLKIENIIEITEKSETEAEAKLSPEASADIIVSVMAAACKDFLPILYDWTLFNESEKQCLKEFTKNKFAFNRAQAKGEIPKSEVFFWDERENVVLEKFQRVEQYKEDAPLTDDQIDQLKLVWKMYFRTKKVGLSPENALLTGMSTILLQKLGPIGKEKIMDLFTQFDQENEF